MRLFSLQIVSNLTLLVPVAVFLQARWYHFIPYLVRLHQALSLPVATSLNHTLDLLIYPISLHNQQALA